MGLFGSIMRGLTREVADNMGNAVSDFVHGVVNDAAELSNVKKNDNNVGQKITDMYEGCSFNEKLNTILGEIGGQANGYELKQNIALEEAEAMCGREIYTRRTEKYYCMPENISYGIYKNGTLKVYIRLWKSYNAYNHVANREVLANCNECGIKMIDFFDYMPNEYNYMKERIGNYIN